MSHKITILPSLYFPPIQFFSKYFINASPYIYSNEAFVKQSYRNRCEILGSQGILRLSIPVVSGKSQLLTHQVEISYEEDWPRNHLKTIQSCYGKAPFFEHYFPRIKSLLLQTEPSLIKLNLAIIEWIEEVLDLPHASQIATITENANDCRYMMHPKEKYRVDDPDFKPKTYMQCFQTNDVGFVPNLSILDLLLNEGPNGVSTLQQSVS